MLTQAVLLALGTIGGAGVGAFACNKLISSKERRIAGRKGYANQLRRLRDDHDMLKFVVEHANDGILIQTQSGHIEWCNPAYSRMTGYEKHEITGRKPQEFILPETEQLSAQEIEDFRYDISSGELEDLELVRNVRKNGELFWNQLSFAVAEFNDATEPKIVVIARDVSEQVEREQRLELSESRNRALAEIDSLTQLPNRLKLTQYLEQQADLAQENGTTVGILHIDLDRFKSINDTMGHAAGDTVLQHAANQMRDIVGEQGLVGRFGGDEFLIVCPETSGFMPIKELADKILIALEAPFQWQDKVLRFGCSIGAAITGPDASTATDLIKHADVALYEVKKRGRHGVCCFNEALGIVYKRRMTLSAQLALAIDNDELDVDLQPQFDMVARNVHGIEALIRWYHPELGKLGPHEFLEHAEQNGLMAKIDEIAAEKAFQALSKLHQEGHRDLRVSINVSMASLAGQGFVQSLCERVRNNGLSPDDVTVEMLETNLLDGGNSANAEAIRELANEGFRIELDDFGMGHAGLAHLARLTTNGLKIDRSMIRNMLLDPTTFTIVRAIIGLSQELGLSVVAEGVEEVEQAVLLSEAKCDVIQGFGIGHPMSLDDLRSWLSDSSNSPVISSLLEIDRAEQEVREILAS